MIWSQTWPRTFSLAVAALTLLAFAGAAAVRADAPPAAEHPAKAPAAHTAVNFFDSARHMHIAEVKPGMTGYGLTVFKGSKIEKFDVEVLSVLKNFNARSDVILIRCKGAYMEHTGSIAGMSGSPIYLTDDTGHARMVGAFAYGWPMTKDPIAGVQPIEYMLKLPAAHRSRPQMSAPATSPSATSPSAGVRDHSAPAPAREHAAWSMRAAGMLPVAWQNRGRGQMITTPAAETKTGQLLGDGEGMRIEPLATPLMTSGMSPELFALLAPRFRAAGLVPLQSGGGGAAAGRDNPVLEPGSVLAVPLLTGDLEMTAIGTTTEVIGNRVWGFGHPFNNEGPISLPMGSGVINGIIANLNTSFKLGSLTRTCGTLNTDESVGVAGETGALPSGVPIEMTVEAADGTPPRTYHFNASRHPKFTPMLTAAAFAAAVTGSSELPQYNTVDYDVQLTFSNGQTVILANRAVNVTSADLFGDAGVVMQAAAENPFQRVMVTRVVGHVKIHPILAAAQIIDVNLPRSKYRPGDKVAAFVTYQPFRSSKAVLRLELELPHDLPHGQYQLIISDAQRYFTDEQVSKPFRFMAESIDDVFAVLRDVGGIRENAIYLRLQRHPDGVAIGRTALQRLPSNRREIMLGAGRSNTTAFISSTVKIVPTELVMTGASEFTIEVETPSKVVVGAPRGAKTEAAAAPKTDEPKKVAPAADVPGKKDTPKESKPRE